MIISDRRQVIITATQRGRMEAQLLQSDMERQGYRVCKTLTSSQIILDGIRDIDGTEAE